MASEVEAGIATAAEPESGEGYVCLMQHFFVCVDCIEFLGYNAGYMCTYNPH